MKYNVYIIESTDKLNIIEDTYGLVGLRYEATFNTEKECIAYIEKTIVENDRYENTEFTILTVY